MATEPAEVLAQVRRGLKVEFLAAADGDDDQKAMFLQHVWDLPMEDVEKLQVLSAIGCLLKSMEYVEEDVQVPQAGQLGVEGLPAPCHLRQGPSLS